MDGVSVIETISQFLGVLPPAYTWVIGACVLILFTFIASTVFDFIASFFGFIRFGGDRRG